MHLYIEWLTAIHTVFDCSDSELNLFAVQSVQ